MEKIWIMQQIHPENTTILIIDDDQNVRKSIGFYLEDSNFNVLQAENGRQGLDMILSLNIDIVLLDLRMPEMDGIALLSVIRKEYTDIPVIVVSGAGVLQDAIEALRLGAFDYITKPIPDMAMLEHSIINALERKRLINENREYHELLEIKIKQRTASLEERTEALRRSEAKFRELTDLLPQTVFEIDQNGQFKFINQFGLKTFGYSNKDIQNISARDLFYDSDSDRVMENIKKVVNGIKLNPSEYIALRNNGSTFPVIIYTSQVIHADTAVGLRGVIFDLTYIKRTEKALRDSQEHLDAVIRVFEGFIYTVSQTYQIRFMNQKLKAYVGGNGTSGICYKTIYGLKHPCAWCVLPDVFSGKTIRQENQNPINGQWYYSIVSPVRNSEGIITEIQSIIIDITDRKLAEEALRQSEAHLREENIRLKTSLKDANQFGRLIGKSAAMRQIYDIVIKASLSEANVIIYGESGTGKELVAKTIHEFSKRRDNKFIPVNCAAIPDNLIESEFFGYKKGAFTGAQMDKPGFFAQAESGTLFLDEIGEINLNMQVKLLRAIAGDGYTPIGGSLAIKPNIRLIAATNKNLEELVNKGSIREDFYYRIHIIPIHLPPLRDRKEDIPLLIQHFLQQLAEEETPPVIPVHIIKSMYNNHWRGNVRELENAVHRYVTLKEFDYDSSSEFHIQKQSESLQETGVDIDTRNSLKSILKNVEKQYIIKLLNENQWNRTKVAKIMGIDRRTLFRKIKVFQIE
jgi:PAS domain S-box-containing protein